MNKNPLKDAARSPITALLAAFLAVSALLTTACASTMPSGDVTIYKRDRYGEGPVIDLGRMKTAADISGEAKEEEERLERLEQAAERQRTALREALARKYEDIERLKTEIRILQQAYRIDGP